LIVLDTHARVWWAVASTKLSAAARRAIEGAGELAVSPMSYWEVAMLVERGRLVLDRDVLTWIRQALAMPRVVCVPLLPGIAVAASSFAADFHGDPVDRILVATAQHLQAPLVTKDDRIRSSKAVRTIW
jgi:PIN domain nuclease of toxin-antitoxin system